VPEVHRLGGVVVHPPSHGQVALLLAGSPRRLPLSSSVHGTCDSWFPAAATVTASCWCRCCTSSCTCDFWTRRPISRETELTKMRKVTRQLTAPRSPTSRDEDVDIRGSGRGAEVSEALCIILL
jgi:hypothetical protein